MSIRSPAEHENGGFSSRLVIPAQAGIHPHPSLDTGFRRYDGTRPTTPCSYFCAGIFEGGREGHEASDSDVHLAKHVLSFDEGTPRAQRLEKIFFLKTLRPLRLCERYSEIWLRQRRARYFVIFVVSHLGCPSQRTQGQA
jgi:hypothetical protein